MKQLITIAVSIVLFLCITTNAYSESTLGLPIKYINGCEIDLNNDGEQDIALLIENSRGYELLVLIANEDGYKSFKLSRGGSNLILSCKYAKTIKETTANKGKGRIFKTNGTCIQLSQPESSSRVYFWHDGNFKEVWTSD